MTNNDVTIFNQSQVNCSFTHTADINNPLILIHYIQCSIHTADIIDINTLYTVQYRSIHTADINNLLLYTV